MMSVAKKSGAKLGDELVTRQLTEGCMARDKNTFEKHRREMEKKRKAEEKRRRRQKKKEQVEEREPGSASE